MCLTYVDRFRGLAGFLLAKNAAARSRQRPKDWYDIAFVLLHNDEGGPEAAAHGVLKKFPDELSGPPPEKLTVATTATRETLSLLVPPGPTYSEHRMHVD